MNCRDTEPLLHARLDSELDVAGSLTVDKHLFECRACAAQFGALQSLQKEIAAADPAYGVPPRLERWLVARFTQRTSLRAHWRSAWRAAAALAGAAACIAVLLVFLPTMRSTGGTSAVATEILDAHLRALQPGHLFDVQSSDEHTVKPWYQGKTDFSPPVPDLSNDGFVLVGGRLEVIRQQLAAAIVYQRRQHVVSLYVSPSLYAEAKPEMQHIGGYHMLHWSKGNMGYCAVSDLAVADLRDFATLIDQARENSR